MSNLHFRITHQEWVSTVVGLTGAEIKVLFYCLTLDPFGDRELEYSVTAIASALHLTKGTVSKALKRLNQLSLIELEIVRAKVRVNPSVFPIGNQVSCTEPTFPIGNPGFPEETSKSYRKRANPIGNEQELEPLPDKDSRSLQTNKTNKTNKTLSTEGERENAIQSSEALRVATDDGDQNRSAVPWPPHSAHQRRKREQQQSSAAPQQDREKYCFEFAPGIPIEAYFNDVKKRFLDQGGRWADFADSNAWSFLYKNPQRTEQDFKGWLAKTGKTLDNLILRQSNGCTDIALPSTFGAPNTPTLNDLAAKLMQLGEVPAQLPESVATPSAPPKLTPSLGQEPPQDAWKEQNANLLKLREMCRNVTRPLPKVTPIDDRDELTRINNDLADPLLREEAIAAVKRSDRYLLEWDGSVPYAVDPEF